MTNFEKWKEGLTVEDITALMVRARDCTLCPVGDCDNDDDESRCVHIVKQWANAEVQDTLKTRGRPMCTRKER